MTDNDNKNKNNQIIPVGKQQLTKVSKTLAITNKLIQEIAERNALPSDDFKVFIPDINFQNYLKEDFGVLIADNYVSYGEIKNIEKIKIDCKTKEITSLEGIQYFTALTYLKCGDNQLTHLDVSKNVKMTFLDCSRNKLTHLDVSKNVELTYLSCEKNQLTHLDVSKNIVVFWLFCEGNQLTHLDVSKNVKLTFLSCETNQLTHLDVSKNIELKTLRCYNNELTQLDVSKNTMLKDLRK